MAQISQLSLPQLNPARSQVNFLNNVGITPSSVCLCCSDQNVHFVKLATCKHCCFFEALLKHKVRYREAVVCYQCHSFLKKIELFKNRAEESLLNLSKHAQTMKISSDLDLSYSVPEILTIPSYMLSDYSNLQTGVTVKNVMNEGVLTNQEAVYNTQEIKIEYEGFQGREPDSVPDVHIEKLIDDGISTFKTEECKKSYKQAKKETEVMKNKQESDQYEGKIIRVTISKQQLLEERQENALKEDYLERPFKCETCILGFQNNSSYTDHMEQKHTIIKGCFQCPICLTMVKSHHGHMRRHFTRYECGVCGKKYLTFLTALTHYNKEHEVIESTFKCGKCEFFTDSYQKLKHHRRKEHNNAIMCNLCYKIVTTNFGLKMHMLTHERDTSQRIPCIVCSKMFINQKTLLVHLKSVHTANTIAKDSSGNGAYCVECDIQFRTKSGLNNHIKSHSKHRTAENEFVCHDCGAAYGLKYSLRQHIEYKHLNIRPLYKCDKCSKTYRYKSMLRKHHKIIHENIKRPKNKVCDICARAFHTLQTLRSHIRTHTGERPYKCTECSATFGHSAALYTHKKLKHKNKIQVIVTK